MAEIENCPKSRLPLILRHNHRLDLAGTDDKMLHRRKLHGQHLLGMLFQIREKCLVINHAIFDNLTQSRRKFPARQRRKACQIDEDALRLIKRADHIFSKTVIDRHLAADAGIHLRQKTCRNLHEGHAPHIRRRDETCEVADHAAAQSDNRRLSVQPYLDGLRVSALRLRQRLRAFPRRNQQD